MYQRALRVLAAVAIAGAATVGFVLDAGAATPPDPGQPLFGLRPALAGRTTLTNGHFAYALGPGATIRDDIDVVNFTPGPLNVELYPANLNPVAGGGLAPGQAADPSAGATGWITLEQADLTVAPRSEAFDGFTLTVPRATPPGDYLASVVGTHTGTTPAEPGLSLQSRVALTMEVTVVGKLRSGLHVGAIHTRRSGGAERLTLDVTNTGNTVVTLTGELTVNAGGTPRRVRLGPSGIYAIPHGTAHLSGSWTKLPLFGTAHLEGAVTAWANGRRVGTYRSPTLQLWFVPWLDLALAGGSVMAAACMLMLSRGRRAAWRTRRADEREIIRKYRAARASSQA